MACVRKTGKRVREKERELERGQVIQTVARKEGHYQPKQREKTQKDRKRAVERELEKER